ncbi:hypothetical protein BDF20DRAFT_845438 [Mycotypha africana]|uniref:uncharacterized protein n=1 Tax=Mycotypha africana TaxID=64632 RepID=UPI0023003F25|nr:uncharacterized protein BDF20DRAFT_845438 [Mycotypha africana]KAI8991597.1 hypothetical protein BDF20DRAFT_845438 [Mycotypha africana]
MWGRLFHAAADAVLISTALAAVRRESGIQPKLQDIESEEVRKYVGKYLDAGEYVLDKSIEILEKSPYFEKSTTPKEKR